MNTLFRGCGTGGCSLQVTAVQAVAYFTGDMTNMAAWVAGYNLTSLFVGYYLVQKFTSTSDTVGTLIGEGTWTSESWATYEQYSQGGIIGHEIIYVPANTQYLVMDIGTSGPTKTAIAGCTGYSVSPSPSPIRILPPAGHCASPHNSHNPLR